MDYDLADDLISQTFIQAYTKLNTFKDIGFLFSTWLYGITINELNQYFGKEKNAVRHVAIDSENVHELIEDDRGIRHEHIENLPL